MSAGMYVCEQWCCSTWRAHCACVMCLLLCTGRFKCGKIRPADLHVRIVICSGTGSTFQSGSRTFCGWAVVRRPHFNKRFFRSVFNSELVQNQLSNSRYLSDRWLSSVPSVPSSCGVSLCFSFSFIQREFRSGEVQYVSRTNFHVMLTGCSPQTHVSAHARALQPTYEDQSV